MTIVPAQSDITNTGGDNPTRAVVEIIHNPLGHGSQQLTVMEPTTTDYEPITNPNFPVLAYVESGRSKAPSHNARITAHTPQTPRRHHRQQQR